MLKKKKIVDVIVNQGGINITYEEKTETIPYDRDMYITLLKDCYLYHNEKIIEHKRKGVEITKRMKNA